MDTFDSLFADAPVLDLPFVVFAATGERFDRCETMDAAQALADKWNAEEDPRERTATNCYPFRAEKA